MKEFVFLAEDKREKTMDLTRYIFKAYYLLTAYIPRRLPRTVDEFYSLQYTLITYYGLEDREDVWLAVCGHITSTPATKLRKSYADLANPGKRLSINKIAQDQKQFYISELENKLKEATEKLVRDEEANKQRDSDPILSIGSLDLQRDMQVM